MAATTTRTARIEARISPDLLATVKRAAELQGRSVSDFVVTATAEAAQKIVTDAELIRLSRAAKNSGERWAVAAKIYLAIVRVFTVHCDHDLNNNPHRPYRGPHQSGPARNRQASRCSPINEQADRKEGEAVSHLVLGTGLEVVQELL